jgi:hypothetical protein
MGGNAMSEESLSKDMVLLALRELISDSACGLQEHGRYHYQGFTVGSVHAACSNAHAFIESQATRIMELDPDPVVCGCREASCPHTPIAKLPRNELVKHFREQVASLERDKASLEKNAARYREEDEVHWRTRGSLLAQIEALAEGVCRPVPHNFCGTHPDDECHTCATTRHEIEDRKKRLEHKLALDAAISQRKP